MNTDTPSWDVDLNVVAPHLDVCGVEVWTCAHCRVYDIVIGCMLVRLSFRFAFVIFELLRLILKCSGSK